MSFRLFSLLMALYPRAWRERYAEELSDLCKEFLNGGEATRLRLATEIVVAASVERGRALRSSRHLALLGGCAGLVVAVVAISAVTNGFGLLVATPSTKGTLPIEASGNGHIDLSEVPDFLAIALQNNRIVGYAPKKYLFPEGKNWMLQRPAESVPATVSLYSSFTTGNDWTPAKSAPASVPVYSSDLKTLVGVFYPGAWSVVTVIASASMPSTPPRTVADGQSKETSGSGSATVTWSDGPGRFAPKGVSELMALDAEIVLGLVSHDCRRFVR